MNVLQKKMKVTHKIYQFRADDLEGKIEYLAKQKRTNNSQIIKEALNIYIREEQKKMQASLDRKSLRGMGNMSGLEQAKFINLVKNAYQEDIDYELFD